MAVDSDSTAKCPPDVNPRSVATPQASAAYPVPSLPCRCRRDPTGPRDLKKQASHLVNRSSPQNRSHGRCHHSSHHVHGHGHCHALPQERRPSLPREDALGRLDRAPLKPRPWSTHSKDHHLQETAKARRCAKAGSKGAEDEVLRPAGDQRGTAPGRHSHRDAVKERSCPPRPPR